MLLSVNTKNRPLSVDIMKKRAGQTKIRTNLLPTLRKQYVAKKQHKVNRFRSNHNFHKPCTLINSGKTVKLQAKQHSLYGDNAMQFLQLAKTRQSTRTYIEKPVETEKIERCLEAARLAPSACNCQPWKFIVVDDPELKTMVANQTFGKVLSFNRFTLQAPVIVLIIAQRQKAIARLAAVIKNRPLIYFDIGIAAEHFCLQAAEEGLGTCMLGWFKDKVIKKQLHIPRNKRVELLITLGYPPSDEIREKKRKNIDQIRTYNYYDAGGETETA